MSGIPQASVPADSDALLYDDSNITLGSLITQGAVTAQGAMAAQSGLAVTGDTSTDSVTLGDYTITINAGVLEIAKSGTILFTLDDSACP